MLKLKGIKVEMLKSRTFRNIFFPQVLFLYVSKEHIDFMKFYNYYYQVGKRPEDFFFFLTGGDIHKPQKDPQILQKRENTTMPKCFQ